MQKYSAAIQGVPLLRRSAPLNIPAEDGVADLIVQDRGSAVEDCNSALLISLNG